MTDVLAWVETNITYLVLLLLLAVIVIQTGRINSLTTLVCSQDRLIKYLKARQLERREVAKRG